MVVAISRTLPFTIFLGFLILLLQLRPNTTNAQEGILPSQDVLRRWRESTFLYGTLSPVAEAIASPQAAPLGWDLRPGQALVWQQNVGNNWEIFSAAHLGNTIRQNIIHENPAPQFRPRLRPDTPELVYVLATSNSESDLMKADLHGNAPINLTNSPGIDDQHMWSQDGRYLYFASTRDGNWELYRMDSDGANTIRLTQEPAPNLYPAISPDGNTLAWITYASNTTGAIFLQELATGAVQQITPILEYPSELLWNYNGTKLHFSYDGNDDFWFDIGEVNRDGSGLQRLRGAPFWSDLVPNSRYLGDDDLFISRYDYGVANNQLVLQELTVQRLRLPESNMELWLDHWSNLISDADVQVIDRRAPDITMNPFPAGEWVRAQPWLGVTWRISDTSIITGANFDVQQRLNGGEWTTVFTGLGEALYTASPPPGLPVEFRVRGQDRIGNLGEWSAPTRLIRTYKFALDFDLTDNRAIPIHHTTIGGAALLGQERLVDGRLRAYLTYLGFGEVHPMNFGAEGYKTFPAYLFEPSPNATTPYAFQGYLRGVNELLTNGDFEENFVGWRTWLTTINAPYTHTGERAALLSPTQSGGSARLYRPIIIPAGMYQPTLAFEYSKRYYAAFPLRVLVHDGVTESVAFTGSNTANSAFNMGWVDMSPWAGETVTVTFSLAPSTQANPLNTAIIDNVSLTSWVTPLIESVSPTEIPFPTDETVVTITGENLIAPLIVMVGETEIEATVIDPQTVNFAVPATMAPGWYPLRIRNGEDVPATWNGVLKIGNSITLPMTYRNELPDRISSTPSN